MGYTAITSRKIPSGTQVVSTYGAQSDGRTYYPGSGTGVMKWFTDKAASTNVEFLKMYLRAGETLSLYDDYFADIPAQSGPRIICPAGTPGESDWQGHNGTKHSGVGFAPSTGAASWAYEIDQPNVRVYDLILQGVSGKRCIYIGSISGTVHIVGNVLVRIGTTPTSNSQNAIGGYAPSATIYVVNNIIDGFYQGVAGEFANTSCVYNNTMVDMINAGVYTSTGIGTRLYAYCYNNCYYNVGAASSYPSGQHGTNVTLDSASDFVDYANQDYSLSSTASEARDTGTDLHADSRYAFDDDIQNETRSARDVGADGFSASPSLSELIMSWNLLEDATPTLSELIMSWNLLESEPPVVSELVMSWNLEASAEVSPNFTTYFKRAIFDALFGITPFTFGPMYLALGNSEGVEPNGRGYQRCLVTDWAASVDGVIETSTDVVFQKSTATWGVISTYMWRDAATSGNLLSAGNITNGGNVSINRIVTVPAGNLVLSLGGTLFNDMADIIMDAMISEGSIEISSLTLGLLIDTPNLDGTFTEVSATGYSRASVTIGYNPTVGMYVNTADVTFPEVQSGNDWGSVTGYVIFADDEPVTYGTHAAVTVDYATYGVTGYSVPANRMVLEVV